VFVISAEDSFARIIKPRFAAVDGALDKFAKFEVVDSEGARFPDLPEDVAELEAAVAEHQAALVIVDPLNAFLSGSIDSWKDHGIRRALAPLARMAEQQDCAMLVVVHLNKQRGGDPLYRIGGSIGQVGAARSVLSFGRDPQDPQEERGKRRLLGHLASNWGELEPTQLYEIERVELELDDEWHRTSKLIYRGDTSRVTTPMKPQVVFHQLSRLLDDDAIITCDAGTDTTWLSRHVQMRGEMQFALSGTLSSMGCALPYAVGAAVACHGRQVICVAGDGAFTMLMGELATLARYNLPVKIVLVKNNELNQVRWEQVVQFGYPEFAVELQPIDFAAVARACGAAGYKLEDPAQAEAVLREALTEPGPALAECVVDPNEPPMPGKLTTDQAVGFAETLAKGQPDRFKILREGVEATARELRDAPGTLF
jgi:Thiamine pyrophosphate enzyme, C-terminal TPP binding domain/AAA domain